MSLPILIMVLAAAISSGASSPEPSSRPANSEDELTRAEIEFRSSSDRLLKAEEKLLAVYAKARAKIDAMPDVAKLKVAMDEVKDRRKAVWDRHQEALRKGVPPDMAKCILLETEYANTTNPAYSPAASRSDPLGG